MEFHPHIHSIVTDGGLKNNHWISCTKNYLFKVQVLGSLFKGKFLSYLKDEFDNLILNDIKELKSFNKFLESLYNKTWIIYIEPLKGKAENVIEYVGRYSFRVAISNERIKNIENDNVTFEYKDYKDNSKLKLMTITTEEFIRRFLLHVLPNNFTKIKHYGILSNKNKKMVQLIYYLYFTCFIYFQKINQKKNVTFPLYDFSLEIKYNNFITYEFN